MTTPKVVRRVTAALTGKKLREAKRTVFRVTNDPAGEGKAFIRALKQHLNRDDFTLRVRFRGPRPLNKNHTHKEDAKWFAVYIDKAGE